MSKLTAVLAGVLIPAFLLAGAAVNPAMAREKAKAKMEKAAGKATIKEVTQDDKARGYEAIFKPGDEAPSAERPFRVVRYLTVPRVIKRFNRASRPV